MYNKMNDSRNRADSVLLYTFIIRKQGRLGPPGYREIPGRLTY